MSRWDYIATPQQSHEAVEAAHAAVVADGLLVGGTLLGDTPTIYVHEEAPDKPTSRRWVLFAEASELLGKLVTNNGGEKVLVACRVVGPAIMLTHGSPSFEDQIKAALQWHAAIHDLIQQSLVGRQLTGMTVSETALRMRLLMEPTKPQYDETDKTRESDALYAVTIQPK